MGKKDNIRLIKRDGASISKMSLLPLLFLLALALPCSAETQEATQLSLRLTDLVPFSTADLRGAKASLTVSIPVPERWRIHEATLHFAFVNSSSLLSQRSLLVTRLNDHVLAQVTLEPRSPEGEVDVGLPPKMLKPGYNRLEFTVAQNYTEECSNPEDPVLWTSIELDRSYLEISYSWENVPLSLASIADVLFDPKIPGDNEVHLVLPIDRVGVPVGDAEAVFAVELRVGGVG